MRESGYADVHAGQLYYEIAGEGQPLVLIHAGIADSRMWDGQFEAFAQHYRVVRYDLRGFGKTRSERGVSFAYRQDLYELLEHLKIGKAFVVGLSMGGGIAVDFALEHPDRVAALIPVASGLNGYEAKPRDDEKSKFEQAKFQEMEELWKKKEHARLIELELEVWVDGPFQPPDRVAPALREQVRAMNTLAYTHDAEELKPQRMNPPASTRLGEIHAPTLVIVGDLDTYDVIEGCHALTQGIAGAREVVFPGVAHMVNMEKPVEFNRVVLDFLNNL
jgi:pimeloyl-ACP methyl ester carboxylesterase